MTNGKRIANALSREKTFKSNEEKTTPLITHQRTFS
jgi:hypothetical protein